MADGTTPQTITPADGSAGPSAPIPPVLPGKKPWALLMGGTFALAAAGVGAMQLIDSEPAKAAPAPVEQAARPVADGSKVLAKLSDGTNAETITYDQVAAEAMSRYGVDVLDAMVNRATVKLACEARGVSVTGAEVNAEITAAAKKYEVDRGTYLQMLQQERGVTPQQYARDVVWPKLALEKLADTQVAVTPEDVRKAFIRTYGPKVKARMIMTDNVRRAQEIYREAAAAPDEFGRLAREHSIDEGSKALDGVIPPISMYGSPETAELEQKAFKLRDGEISGIIQLPFVGMRRYVILKREGLTEAAATKLEDVRPFIEEELREQKVQESVAKVFTQIRDRTTVRNFLTGVVTDPTTAGKAAASAPRPATR